MNITKQLNLLKYSTDENEKEKINSYFNRKIRVELKLLKKYIKRNSNCHQYFEDYNKDIYYRYNDVGEYIYNKTFIIYLIGNGASFLLYFIHSLFINFNIQKILINKENSEYGYRIVSLLKNSLLIIKIIKS